LAAIASMTGFAREAGATGAVQWAWELRTVNGRGLDIRVRVPSGLEAAGEEARQLIRDRFSRGQCQLGLTLSRSASASRVRINEDVLASLVDALGRMRLPPDLKPPSVDGLLAVRGVVEIDETNDAPSPELAAALKSGAARLVESVGEVRRAEGAALGRAFSGQLAQMAELIDAAEACPGRQPEAVRARLSEQVGALLGTGAALDPDRLHQEAVLLAARADIREELDRLRAHVAAARELLGAGGSVGRRLDFLAQELGREANTLCAKANDVALSRIGLELKTVVEQFREQAQNVE
jgi:uncharacterized protein (TIGR00255 family)